MEFFGELFQIGTDLNCFFVFLLKIFMKQSMYIN